ncbi:hypothetical protein GCM10010294_63030 [Streptomyces griseoloalbus]|nr:hypothetical protein GCM10010294_63030 [Streptomyces griseoloalbus]
MQHPHRIPRGSAPGRGIAARAAHRREAQTDRDPDRDHHAADPPVPLLPSNHRLPTPAPSDTGRLSFRLTTGK